MSTPTKREILDAIKSSVDDIWTPRSKGLIVRECCPLCKIFNAGDGEDCHGCPIAAKTGKTECINTPYYDWADSRERETALVFRDWLQELYVEYLEKYFADLEGRKKYQELKDYLKDIVKGAKTKKEKEEVWVNVTEEIKFKKDFGCDDRDVRFEGTVRGIRAIRLLWEDDVLILRPSEGFKITNSGVYNYFFRILKREYK